MLSNSKILWKLSLLFFSSFASLSSLELKNHVITSEELLRAQAPPLRDYEKGPSKYQTETVRWIIRTIATRHQVWLGLHTKEINKKKESILDLHPLNFLLIIFSDEELKCCAHIIRDKTFVSGPFYEGNITSLQQEADRNNMKISYVKDFAKKVKINPSLIIPLIQKEKWEDFINCLIDNIPRENNPNRYNI